MYNSVFKYFVVTFCDTQILKFESRLFDFVRFQVWAGLKRTPLNALKLNLLSWNQ